MMVSCYHSGAYCKDNLMVNLLELYVILKVPYMQLTP